MSVIFDLAAEQRGKVVHRAALLAELLKPIDKTRMHTDKKVVYIKDLDTGRVLVHFADGTTFEADAVIGADGVRGYIREYVLGSDHLALKPQFAGFWDARSLIPMQKAKELLGEEYFEVPRQYGWVGDGGFFMHDVLDGGETVQCVVCGVADEHWGEEPSHDLNKEALEKAFKTWTDTPIKQGIIKVGLANLV